MTVMQASADSARIAVDRLLFWVIALSSAAFVLILVLAAYWDRTIIWLHLFQSLQYVAIVGSAARRNRWAYLLGMSVAAFWIYVGAFVTDFVESGLQSLEIGIRSGVLTKPDQVIAVFAAASQLLLMLACLGAYLRFRIHPIRDWLRASASLVFAVGYLLACFAFFQPRYLAMVPRLAHPHAWSSST